MAIFCECDWKDRADQPRKVTCVSCADKSICRAHFTSSTFFKLLQQNSVSIKHGKKHCSVLIVVIHRQRHHLWTKCLSFSKHFPPFHSPFTFFFSVDRAFSLLRGQVNPLVCIILFFLYSQSVLTRSKCLFPYQSFAKVLANMMYTYIHFDKTRHVF